MQLPQTDELVMVSGCPPIRARKVRYFEDKRLAERVLPPPAFGEATTGDAAVWREVVGAPDSGAVEESALVAGGGLAQELEPGLGEAAARVVEVADEIDTGPTPPLTAGPGPGKPARRNARVARQASLDPDDGIPL